MGEMLINQSENKKIKERASSKMEIDELKEKLFSLQSEKFELELKLEESENENALYKENYSKLKALYDLAPVGYISLDKKGVVFEANKTSLNLLGMHYEDLVGRQFSGLIANEDKDKFNYMMKKLININSNQGCEIKINRSNGQIFNVKIEGNFVEHDGHSHYHIVISDNTFSKLLETNLREKERMFRSLVEGLDEAVFQMTIPDGKFEYISPSATDVFGYPIEKFFSNSPFIRHIIHPDIRKRFEKRWDQLLEGKVQPVYEYKILDQEGNARWIMQSNRAVYDSSGKIIKLEGICRNITEIKLAHEAMKESEERFRAIANYTYDWENWVAPNGQIIWINPSVERITGYSPDECLEMDDFPFCILHDDFQGHAKNEFMTALKNHAVNHDIPFKIICKDGTPKWMSVSWQPIYSQTGEYIGQRSSIRDITKRMEAVETMEKLIEELRVSNEIIKNRVFELDEWKQKYYSVRNKHQNYKSNNDRFLSELSNKLIDTFLGFNTVEKFMSGEVSDEKVIEIKKYSNLALRKASDAITLLENYLKNKDF